MITDKDLAAKRGRLMYHIEAALEYLISILVNGSFLATLTKELGIDDSITGILSSIISLGCLFQLVSIFIIKKRYKGFITLMSVLNQLLFMILYIIPLSNGSKNVKIVLFIIIIISAYLIYYVAHPKKINWFMSNVEDSSRGSFTARKEIISLISGIIFSFLMGYIIDFYIDKGQNRLSFVIAAGVMFALTALHTLTVLFTPEISDVGNKVHKTSIKNSIKSVFSNKNLLHVVVLFILYYIATYCASPFYGTYEINELGFSLMFVSFISMLSSISRILVSTLWGRYADKTSFANMFEKCSIILGLGVICATLATPGNGKIMFSLYYILKGIAMGGINSATINLVFDYVSPAHRSDSLAICLAASGTAGFVSTLFASPLVKIIQKYGLSIFGFNIYAQQAVSAISLLFIVIMILYTKFVIKKLD